MNLPRDQAEPSLCARYLAILLVNLNLAAKFWPHVFLFIQRQPMPPVCPEAQQLSDAYVNGIILEKLLGYVPLNIVEPGGHCLIRQQALLNLGILSYP